MMTTMTTMMMVMTMMMTTMTTMMMVMTMMTTTMMMTTTTYQVQKASRRPHQPSNLYSSVLSTPSSFWSISFGYHHHLATKQTNKRKPVIDRRLIRRKTSRPPTMVTQNNHSEKKAVKNEFLSRQTNAWNHNWIFFWYRSMMNDARWRINWTLDMRVFRTFSKKKKKNLIRGKRCNIGDEQWNVKSWKLQQH